RELHKRGGREADAFYRDRWSYDKVVRSPHGVNCAGSCSWTVHVPDGTITWEPQETDYPSLRPDPPEDGRRGCPRGAPVPWATRPPTRVRYPYTRAELLRTFRALKQQHGDPVDAWGALVENPELARKYKAQRGKGG